MKDDKKRINLIDIEPDTHDWLVRLANEKGMSIKDFAGYLLDDARGKWKHPDSSEPERLALWNYYEALAQEQLRKLAYRVAAMYERNQTEEMAETLARQCELAGLDYREVIQQVEDDPFSSLVAFSHNGTKLGDCISWLGDMLAGQEKGLPVRILIAIGKQRGFNETLMNRAKRAMNADLGSPSVTSVRKTNNWFWRLKDEHNEV